jgi:N-acetylmuramoyl-L-alanine amidase
VSYVTPEHDPDGNPRPDGSRRRVGPLTVTLAALAATAVVAWAVLHSPDSGGDASKEPWPQSDRSPASSAAAAPSPAESTGAVRSPSGSPSASPSHHVPNGPLKGKVVVIDPGHNPSNHLHTSEINRPVDIGTDTKECDTTGTATNGGYPEAQFTLDVARRLRTLLEEQGATVVLTQDGHRAWGPCVDERARIGNERHADAAISLHADGAPAGDRGFHVILPAAVHRGAADTRAIAGPSRELGERVVGRFVAVTRSAPSNYVGGGTGLDVRDDLGGLNLSRVPKVFIECGNMRDSRDAALVTSGAWRQKAARGIYEGIDGFLGG